MKKQRGFGLLETVLTLSIVSILALFVMNGALTVAEKNNTRVFAAHVERVITGIQGYQYYRQSNNLAPNPVMMWPSSLDALQDYNFRYWTQCTTAEAQAGRCKRPEYTPFGGVITYQVIDGATTQLTIPTGAMGDSNKVWTAALLQIPFAKVTANGNVEINIYPTMHSVVYDGFVRRDGSTSLTGDWDVGGQHVIANAKDVSAKNADGSQRWLSGGVELQVIEHGDTIDKPSCPGHLVPDLKLAVTGVFPRSTETDFNELSKFRAYIRTDATRYWKIELDYYANHIATDKTKLLHEGEVLAFISCKPKN